MSKLNLIIEKISYSKEVLATAFESTAGSNCNV